VHDTIEPRTTFEEVVSRFNSTTKLSSFIEEKEKIKKKKTTLKAALSCLING
jgi:hypothetical protein